MPATGARRGHLVYHWRHGWIPLDHFAALSKAHHSKSGAVKVMQKHGIDVPKGYSSDRKGKPSAIHARRAETQRSQEAHLRAGAVAHGLKKPQPSAGDLSDAAAQWKRENPGKTIAGHEREVSRIADRLAERKFIATNSTGDTAAQKAAGDARKKAALSHSRQFSALGLDKPKVIELAPRPAPTHSAGMDPHAIRATQLREAAAKKRAEADRIAGSVGAPDRAGAMLRAKDSARMNARMDSGLRRFTEKQREAKALESKAHLAEARSKEATRPKLTHEDVKGATHVRDQFGWHEVVRVNAKTVTVKTPYSWTDSIPHHKVHQVLRATPEQIAAAKAKAARKK